MKGQSGGVKVGASFELNRHTYMLQIWALHCSRIKGPRPPKKKKTKKNPSQKAKRNVQWLAEYWEN